MSRYTENSSPDTEIDVGSLVMLLWRRKGWVVLWTLVGLALAAAFLVVVTPVFQTDARLLIERRETVFTRPNDEQNAPLNQDFDALTVASQVEVLQSRSILSTVAENLKLAEKPEFNTLLNGGGNPISSILSLVGIGSDNVNDTLERRVLAKLADKLSVYSVGDSRVVSVEVTSQDPVLAADIANAISEEYILTQRTDGGTRARDASQFLEREIDSLRAKVSSAEQEVEDFRSSADLIGVDDESTLTKQQLSETLTLLSDVSAQRAEAEAKSDQIRRLIRSGAALDISSDVQGSPLIQRLREQQVTLRARIVDLQTSLLPSHPQVQAARSQLSDLESEIASQALLIARALEGDAEIAKTRQQELEQEVARLKIATGRANEQEIKLRALERDARSQRELLETYLNRFRESTARQNSELLPVNARVISKASVPVKTHFPKTIPTLAVAGFSGGFLASLFILMAELLSGRAMQSRDTRPYRDDERIDPEINRDDIDGFSYDKRSANNRAAHSALDNVPLVAPLSERATRRHDSSLEGNVYDSSIEDEILTSVRSGQPETAEPSMTPEEAQQIIEQPASVDAFSSPESEVEVLKARLASLEKMVSGGSAMAHEPVEPIESVEPDAPDAPDARASDKLAQRMVENKEYVSASTLKAARPLVEKQIEDVTASNDINIKTVNRPHDTDLYNFKDALSAIDRYQLEQVVVLPVFQDFSCADMALELARSIGEAGKNVIFIDTTIVEADDEVPLAGISDVMAGQVPLNEAIFDDPMSSVDLMTSGTLHLTPEDWDEGRAQNVLNVVSQNYDVIVLHAGEGTGVSYLDDLVDRSDMLLFAVGLPLSRRQVADILSQKIGEVPAHSMFVYFDNKDVVSAA